AYLMSHDQILSYQADRYRRRTTAQPGEVNDGSALLASDTQQDAPDQLPASSAPATSVSHKVAAGETLTTIAAKYGVQAADIRTANNLRRNAVRVGQVLTINGVNPDLAASARKEAEQLVAAVTAADQASSQTQAQQKKTADAAAKTPKKKEPAAPAKKQPTAAAKKQKATTHTIKSGENLGRIAKKYGVTVDAIKKANGLKSDAIRAGKELKIPAKK
ncbi:MAG: LysM peptidoglycan-binding domain-containing protein, partial [Muribaculaceae bacterium]|nr:LysM peptidoglycan-binding domain-containing protein [Muribaculaceae bacterium]